MTWPLRFMGGLVVVASLVASAPIRADDDDTIDYRQRIMRTMDEQAAAIAMISQQKAPAANIATHLRILALTASTAVKAFETKVAGGHAKPDVWRNWPDFSKRMSELPVNIAALAKTSETGGITAVAPKLQASLDCKGCHEVYTRPLTAKTPSATVVQNDVIDYREHIMRTLNEQSEALGMILSTAIPDDNASAHLEIIALTASTALKAFEPKILGGESKSAVWTNWPDFSKRMQEFSTKTADAAKLGHRPPES